MSENKYEKMTSPDIEFCEEVRKKYFPELERARVAYVFIKKPRKSRGKLVLGEIKNPSELALCLAEEEFDYVVIIAKPVWDIADEVDKVRLVRHEFRHCFFDPEAKKPWKRVDHDFSDFRVEVEMNADDPNWAEKLALRATASGKE